MIFIITAGWAVKCWPLLQDELRFKAFEGLQLSHENSFGKRTERSQRMHALVS